MKPIVVLVAALPALAAGCSTTTEKLQHQDQRALKAITVNTAAYRVNAGDTDRRSVSLVVPEDLHIVAIEHFNGVQWQQAGTGMEPTGTTGYFGYCGRDYYTEVGGIDDVVAYEAFPAGTFLFVPQGSTLYLHTYANNFLSQPQALHHAVRLLYW